MCPSLATCLLVTNYDQTSWGDYFDDAFTKQQSEWAVIRMRNKNQNKLFT